MSSTPAPKSILKGWDLVYQEVKNALKKKSDVVICMIHWILIMRRDFSCLGIGTEKTIAVDEEDEASDLLPEGWNYTDIYSLRYVKDHELFLLTGINDKDENTDIFVVNFVNVKTQVAKSLVLSLRQNVLELHGKMQEIIPDFQYLIEDIERNLISAVSPAPASPVKAEKGVQARQPIRGQGRGINIIPPMRIPNQQYFHPMVPMPGLHGFVGPVINPLFANRRRPDYLNYNNFGEDDFGMDIYNNQRNYEIFD